MGLSVASFGVANACIADISEPQQKGRRYSWMGMAFGAGYAVGPLLGGLFAGQSLFWGESLIRPFLAATVLTGVNTLLVFLWLPETFTKKAAHIPQTLRSLIRRNY